MRFFIALIITMILGSFYVFGVDETLHQLYVENAFWSYTFTVLIILYIIISMDKSNYAHRFGRD